jgi:hypothetical protein
MSTSEFEECPPEPKLEGEIFCLPNMEGLFPADFTVEEVEFACELDTLFSLEQENLPPLFVQTMVECDDPRYQSVENGFELKTRATVFRRLQLERRLNLSVRPSMREIFQARTASVSRPMLAFCASCLLFVLMTIAATAPAFASGLSYLLSGANSGVVFVDQSPVKTAAPLPSQEGTKDDTQKISFMAAQQRLHFSASVPSYVPARYNQSNFYLYAGNNSWADGPIMVVEYTYALPGVAPKHITICEFKPSETVYLVVKDGAAKRITVNNSSNDTAIFVEGHWTDTGVSNPTWDYNDRSELIDEINGVVFWIVGDPSDGINNAELTSVASSMHVFDWQAFDHIGGHIAQVMQSEENSPDLFADDVVYLDNPDNSDGPAFKVIGATSDQPQPRNTISSRNPFAH